LPEGKLSSRVHIVEFGKYVVDRGGNEARARA
jgi:hypothetical protein